MPKQNNAGVLHRNWGPLRPWTPSTFERAAFWTAWLRQYLAHNFLPLSHSHLIRSICDHYMNVLVPPKKKFDPSRLDSHHWMWWCLDGVIIIILLLLYRVITDTSISCPHMHSYIEISSFPWIEILSCIIGTLAVKKNRSLPFLITFMKNVPEMKWSGDDFRKTKLRWRVVDL